MKSRYWIGLVALVSFLAVLTFLLLKKQEPVIAASNTTSNPALVERPALNPTPQEKTDPDSRIIRNADGSAILKSAVALSQTLNQSGNPERDLEILVELLDSYRSFLGENPIGSENLEIVEQLLGANPKRLIFLDPQHPSLSPEIELLDRWQTPFVFHPLTATAMEVRSAGADKVLWTADDLSLDLEDIARELQL